MKYAVLYALQFGVWLPVCFTLFVVKIATMISQSASNYY